MNDEESIEDLREEIDRVKKTIPSFVSDMDPEGLGAEIGALEKIVDNIDARHNRLNKEYEDCLTDIVLGRTVTQRCFSKYLEMIDLLELKRDAKNIITRASDDLIKLIE